MRRIRREWRCAVTVQLRPGRDADGRLRPGETILIEDVPVTPGESTEAGTDSSPSEATWDLATIYAPPGTPSVPSTATVTVPDGHPLAGEWTVEGKPPAWPKGVVIHLRRVK